jgi:putative FmdB family regulatory protein
MPIYDYRCRACGATFEVLVRGPEAQSCPSCQSQDLERLPSLFAVNSETTRASAIKAARQRLAELERGTADQRRAVIEKHDD